jgi:hypothetical protein
MHVLNVGGGSKDSPLPPQYAGWRHTLLDLDPAVRPDVVCDAREMHRLPAGEYDAVYCAHNLEHYYRHDVPKVLQGFRHVLKSDGFAHVIVPDLHEVMRQVMQKSLDLEDTLYQSGAGAISALDVIYGLGSEIERSGQDFYAHKTGFTQKSLHVALVAAGFRPVFIRAGNLEVQALAFNGRPARGIPALFCLPEGA